MDVDHELLTQLNAGLIDDDKKGPKVTKTAGRYCK